MMLKLKFNVRKGKFKPIRVYGEVEDIEDCSICHNDDKVGEECYYLYTKSVQLQLCKECFEEIKKDDLDKIKRKTAT